MSIELFFGATAVFTAFAAFMPFAASAWFEASAEHPNTTDVAQIAKASRYFGRKTFCCIETITPKKCVEGLIWNGVQGSNKDTP